MFVLPREVGKAVDDSWPNTVKGDGFGRSHELPDALRKGNDRGLMLEDGRWQPLRPFHRYPESLRKKFGLTEFSFGPEIAFAHAMAEAWPNETIGIVK